MASPPVTTTRTSDSPDSPGSSPKAGRPALFPVTSERWPARVWGTLVVLCGVLFLDALDVSMVGVALPSIQGDLGLSTSALQWVVSGYVLGYGGLLLLGGRAADLLGRRRVFLVALAVFAVASLLGALVDNGALLIASRFIKGVSAAFTAPAAMSIITTSFAEGPARNRALSIFAATGATGFSLGLVLSGLLTEVGWRLTLLMPAPVALIVLVAAFRLIPRDRAERPAGGYDLAGAVTSVGGMLLLVFGVVEAPEVGWASPRTVLTLVVAVALLAAFIVIERRSPHPLIRLGILRSRPLARANVGGMLLFGAYVSFQFVVTIYLQTLLDWSPLETALAFLPAGAIVAVASPRIGPLVDRVGTGRLVIVGAVSLLAGYAWFLPIDTSPVYARDILPAMIFLGIGFALSFPSLNIQATDGVPDDEQGLASGLLNTSFQVGGAIILAVVTAVISADGDFLAGLHPALTVVTLIAAVGVLAALTGARRPTPLPATD
ncbi:MFS transporter [Bailinhaonella thermotolerans]|uniref:MFS transporter n=1 Tax=Bailinhaonella thermotolerans TaxID=1070861 RepID=A0A3A4B4G2_9ACTN|nr:MFS transporter [Bailinhaonella thermotolerans]RJL32839.1 MFS transporter [Bailinhaonella thermotolerans]